MNITPFPTLSPAAIDATVLSGQWLAQDDFSVRCRIRPIA